MKKLWLAAAFLSLVAAGCQTHLPEGPGHDLGPFSVTVFTASGARLEGAVIEGGIDWDYFQIPTNSVGQAILPDHARGEKAIIHLDNYFPLPVTLEEPFRYTLAPTPKALRFLGAVEGLLVRSAPGRLATVDYQGTYHLYSVDASGVAEIASVDVPHSVRQTQLIGDLLWFSTYDDGVFVYSLADPEHPVEQMHLDIPGNTPLFARLDNMIVVANDDEVSALGVYLFEPDGSFVETARFFDKYVTAIAFADGFLVVTGSHEVHPWIYSLEDPTNPVLVYDGVDPVYWSGFLFGHQYLQIPEWDQIAENTVYGRLDLTNPALPQPAGSVQADSRLLAVIDDSTAVGRYYTMGLSLSVLKGSLAGGFQTVALISEDPRYDFNDFEGCAPPYYVISDRLYILEDRIITGSSE
ncbi:MAG: hypothetical protein ACXW3H_09245 [Candidatus Aminicenantales bacterium]